MIEITLFYRADGALAGYEFSGHAGAAPYGEDLVCASASTLAIVTANSWRRRAWILKLKWTKAI